MTAANSAVEKLRAAYADPYAAARAHRASGGKVVGYFLNSVPEELIVASGCFPVRLRGEPTQQSARAERYMEEYMDGEVRSIFGAFLEGRFDFVDLVVIPRNSEVYLQLYYFLLEIPKWEADVRLPALHLFDLLQTPNSTTLKYVTGRLHALAELLVEIGGKLVTTASLTQAISRTNAKRALLQRCSTLWHSRTSAISGVDALAIISAASFMRHDEFSEALSTLTAEPNPSALSKPRILLKGSPQSDARTTALIERLGGAVVAHDHLWGDRTYEALVPERSEPWTALARHYALNIPSPREYPQAKADARFLDLVTRAQVEGVIFFHDEWDDTLGWEYPDQKNALDARGIDSLFLKRQPYFTPNETEQAEHIASFLQRVAKR